MKAVTIHDYGGAEKLMYEEVPMPSFGPQEILIRVQATSINPVDWKTREGFNINFPFILGWDVAGAVADVGNLVFRFKIGDLVFALADITRNGAEAEYVVVKTDAATAMQKCFSKDNFIRHSS